jgi:hypothetical protein
LGGAAAGERVCRRQIGSMPRLASFTFARSTAGRSKRRRTFCRLSLRPLAVGKTRSLGRLKGERSSQSASSSGSAGVRSTTRMPAAVFESTTARVPLARFRWRRSSVRASSIRRPAPASVEQRSASLGEQWLRRARRIEQRRELLWLDPWSPRPRRLETPALARSRRAHGSQRRPLAGIRAGKSLRFNCVPAGGEVSAEFSRAGIRWGDGKSRSRAYPDSTRPFCGHVHSLPPHHP